MVKAILKNELQYNKEELDKLEIAETKLTMKGDGIMYIAFTKQEQIKEIYMRKVETRNDYIVVRNFIPPNMYDRKGQKIVH